MNLPNVSTTGKRFTIAFFFAMRITPRANVTVTTIGRPSGIAATAKLKDKTKVSKMKWQYDHILKRNPPTYLQLEFCNRFL